MMGGDGKTHHEDFHTLSIPTPPQDRHSRGTRTHAQSIEWRDNKDPTGSKHQQRTNKPFSPQFCSHMPLSCRSPPIHKARRSTELRANVCLTPLTAATHKPPSATRSHLHQSATQEAQIRVFPASLGSKSSVKAVWVSQRLPRERVGIVPQLRIHHPQEGSFPLPDTPRPAALAASLSV